MAWRRTSLLALCAALLLAAPAGGWAGDEPVVVVVNPAAAAPTRAQVQDIFLGRGGAFRPLDQPARSAVHIRFYERLTGRDLAWVRAAWASVVFTGRGTPPRVLADAEAVKRALAADAGLIAYLRRDELDPRVKAVLELE